SPSFVGKEREFTDHYIKLLFVPEHADYSWPFDAQQIRGEQPRDKQPITRTYTIFNLNSDTGDFDADFLTYGDWGFDGPWSREAQVGERSGFFRPGGKSATAQCYDHLVFAGEGAAARAVGGARAAVPEDTTATAYIEIESEERKFELPSRDGVDRQ